MADVTGDVGTLALLGGAEFSPGGRPLDERLLAASGGDVVLVLPTAAAYEHPGRAVEAATAHFGGLGAKVTGLPVLGRTDAADAANAGAVRAARFVYLTDGSPMHLRSVLKGSALYDALVAAWREGAVLAASGAGAMVLCDPMVDPRGGAFTVGLGLLAGMSVSAHHDRAPAHLVDRSTELRPEGTVLVGLDDGTAIVRAPAGGWTVAGPGAVTLYGPGRGEGPARFTAGAAFPLPGAG